MDEMKEKPGMRRLDDAERKVKRQGREAGKKGGEPVERKPLPRIATEIEEKREEG